MQNNIPIFLASDNNYAPFVATTVASICATTESFCSFYVLDGGISDFNKEKINALKNKFNNFSIEFVKVDEKKYFEQFKTFSYITKAAYYRFLIADLFPILSKALYLDVDIILNGDICDLFKLDLNDYVIGATIDRGDPGYISKLKKNINMKQESPYFNSGVLLINLDLWRKNHITQKLFETEKIYRGKLDCNDQDVLNKVFENDYQILDDKFNTLSYGTDIVLRHYYGFIKPWLVSPDMCLGEFEEFKLFWKYAKMTPFYQEMLSKCRYSTPLQLRMLSVLKKQKEKKDV